MANKQEIIDTQRLLELEQEQLVGYWLKQFGISRKALVDHPQIDDVMLLIKFRSEFWDLNNYRKRQFDNMWSWVYHNKFPLKAKHLKQLKHTGNQIVRWRKKRAHDVEIIKAFRKKVIKAQ